MVDELGRLKSAVSDFEAEADFDFVDPKQLAAVIDRLQGALCKVLDRGRERGDHRLAGLSPASWAARTCGLSRKAAADRLCVGRQLGSLPETAAALAGGAISYQAASALCHHMNEGLLPRRKGVRPHVSLTTTLPGLKRELGAPAAELELGMPISGTTVERLACDCTMSRVLMADCHFHHRLVHEGEWQIVKAGDEFHVIPPERLRSIFVRGPDVTWAA